MQRIHKPDAARHHGAVSLESFDLNLLRVLDALLAARSVSGAARRLDLSQPATSAALARLRSALDDPLLVREGNRMQPTPLADELRPRVVRILEEIGLALGAASEFDPATSRRRFRVGTNDYAALVLLAPLASRLRESAPGTTLEILPCDSLSETRLVSRDLDLVVGDRWTLSRIGHLETLFDESFVSIARADHPRLPRRVTLDAFLAEDHALISPQGVSPGALDHALEALGRTRRVALTVPHYLVAPMILAGTDLVMTLPRRIGERFARAHRLRTFRPPVDLEGFDVVMASHPRSVADPPIAWLKQMMRTTAATLGEARPRGKRSSREP